MSKEREAFEAWALGRWSMLQHPNGDYVYNKAQAAWLGFQQATSHYQPLLDAKDAEIARLRDEAESGKRALQFLDMQGYRKCNISACNCPFWHGGNASERLREIHDVLNDAGARPYEKTAIKAIEGIIDEKTTLKALLEQAREALNDLVDTLTGEPSGNALHDIDEVYEDEFINARDALAAINAATGKGK